MAGRGRHDAAQRANKAWKKALADYEAPAIDPGIDEALREFIERKKASLPDAFGGSISAHSRASNSREGGNGTTTT